MRRRNPIDAELRALERAARQGDKRALIQYRSLLRRLGKPIHKGVRKQEKQRRSAVLFGERERGGGWRGPWASDFIGAYISTALWSSADIYGENLEMHRASDQFLEQARVDCSDFIRRNARVLMHISPGLSGQDFWLTRNRRPGGAFRGGFWDRDLGAVGDRLTKSAHGYGSVDLYVGDDGLVYS